MVSFVCDTCQETLKKAKLEPHTLRCKYAVFSCIDCSVTFQGVSWKSHTSCITEVEKYQKTSYKDKVVEVKDVEMVKKEVEVEIVESDKKEKKEKKEKEKKEKKVIEAEVKSAKRSADESTDVTDAKKEKKSKKAKKNTITQQAESITEIEPESQAVVENEPVSETEQPADIKEPKKRTKKPKKDTITTSTTSTTATTTPGFTKETLLTLIQTHLTASSTPQTLATLKKSVVKDLYKTYKSNENKKSLGSVFDSLVVSQDADGNLMLTL